MECRACHISLSDSAVFCHACGAQQRDAAEPDRFKYAAFISYRHVPRDRDVAIAVQKAIEAYRLPRGIVAAGTAASDDPRMLGKCFRDDDELAASDSLPDRIADALAASRTLIVVCSPDAAQSEWVAREIELFAQLHGRERIVAVLAAGSSSESMPDLLRNRIVIREDGVSESRPVEPLAADLRSGSDAHPSAEKLRIIAAVAGCDYDDLRQRIRSRKRRRAAASGAVALAVAAVVAVSSWVAYTSHRDAQVADSLRLAIESQQLLSKGDRYGAIEVALSALPSSEADTSRPLVPEAQEALEAALQIDLTRGSHWRAAYSIDTEHPMSLLGNGTAHLLDVRALASSAYAVDEQERILAVSDDYGAVNTYDMMTGKHLARCTTPDETAPLVGGAFTRTLASSGGKLAVSHQGAPRAVSCFDSRTGEMLWTKSDASLPVMDMLPGGACVCGALLGNHGGFQAAVFDTEEGMTGHVASFKEEELPSAEQGYAGTIGAYANEFYLAVGDKLMYVDITDDRIVASATLAYPCVTSLEWLPGAVVVASADPIPEEGFERCYAVEAFDEDLNLLWQYEGSFTSQMVVSEETRAFLEGAPVIGGYTANATQVAVAVGREAILFDVATGEPYFIHHAAQTILEAYAAETEDPEVAVMIVSCVDGTVTMRTVGPSINDNGGDSTRLTLGYPIRWACARAMGDDLVVLVAPADDNDRIAAYMFDANDQDEAEQEYSLDQLIEMAKAELAAMEGSE